MTASPNRARDLFLAAVRLAPDQWEGFLAAECGDDAPLRARVRDLLAAHREAGSFLDPVAALAATTDEPAAEQPGTVVGPYKLLEQIGEGGFGTVFMAEQAEPVRRKVALKVLKPGMDSRQGVARFEAERQALAIMDHPNIAKVYDGGVTEAGRLYFVMELVKGVPITQFCDEQKMDPGQRLGLFVQVCRAVQHAHQKGVIHRDLKPSNVLVAGHDTAPVVKVIDFGVAKAVGPALTDKTVFTGPAQMVGTPLYMSPEQAGPSGRDVDTRSDIYSLGVLLYELLTGTTPFSKDRFKQAAYDEIRRIIREEDPPRPSTRLSESKDVLPSVAARRQTVPARLTRLVRGELDWIVMKCLEKDRDRRYETANALARDVERYLADEVVEARPPGVGYRVRKFVRRHRGPLAAGSLILLALVGGLGGAGYGVIEAGNQRVANALRAQAERDRDAAEAAHGEAEIARGEAVAARDGEKVARAELFRESEKLAVFEYGRTVQLAYQAWLDNNIAAARTLLEGTRKDLRGWEWDYVHRLCHPDLVTFQGHTDFVNSAAFSPDGTRVVTASWDKTARIWDAKTGATLLILKGHDEWVRSAAFSPDGAWVVTASWDKTARIWDAKTGEERRALRGRGENVTSAAFSPDGAWVVTGHYDGTARIWDAQSGAERRVLKASKAIVHSAAFSPDGASVVTTCSGSTRIWDAKTGEERRAIQADRGGTMFSAAFSSDGARLVTAGGGSPTRVWDARTGTALGPQLGTQPGTMSAAFSPDGTRVVTANGDKTVQVWNPGTGASLFRLRGHSGTVNSAVFSPDGAHVLTASGDQTARIWDARIGAEPFLLVETDGRSDWAGFGPDRFRVVRGSGGNGAVWIRHAESGAVWLALQGDNTEHSVAAHSRDGTRVVAGGVDAARIWDAETGVERLVIRGHKAPVSAAGFSPDGTRVVTGGYDATARIWDAETGVERLVIRGHSGAVTAAAYSPDGTRVVTGGYGATARIWDATTGAERCVLKGHGTLVTAAAYSPDGAWVVTAGKDTTARIWDAATGEERLVLKGHGDRVSSAAFSPDGARVVTAGLDATVRVWDAHTGAELLALKAPGESPNPTVVKAVFSPDGARLLTADRGGPVRIYDTRPVNRAFRPREVTPRPAKP